jgi:phage minor structural protein
MIVRVPTPKGNQPFRVYNPRIDILGNNEYSARHISYDLLDAFIEDSRPSGNGQTAISAILSETRFTGSSDITTSSAAEYQMMNPIKALLGGNDNDDNAFVNRWGGEIERDNFTIRMNRAIGEDRGVSIRYRKNLTGLTLDTDISDVVRRIYPTGRTADGNTLLKLPEKYIDSPYINNYTHPKIRRYDYSDIKVSDTMTQDQAYAALRAAVQNDFATGIGKPTISAVVEFIPLETTEEYKNLAVLEKVFIGDTVHIYHEPLGLELSAKVVSYEYDCLLQKYSKVTLGSVAQCVGSVRSTIGKLATSAQATAAEANDGVKKANIRIGDLEISIEGKVSFTDLSGDGTTTINGRNITTGRIESEDGSWWLDLETGKFYLEDGTFAGEIVWSDSNGNEKASIKYGGQAGLIISSVYGVTFGQGSITVPYNCPMSIDNLTANGVELDSNYSGEQGITMSNGTKRTWMFEAGMLTNNDV